ncbi:MULTISPECIES: DUF2226 domain-containing protein [unclassified Archaeoglobus]|jgi:hypothetical protein|uniref:DUF2226 domain-containing protein n=1 Tax=unclassified Archaeoglobus TaxID=2643606 RepID=UPI0025B86E40|nr:MULTISPECIES: DUF2226 domain-containing protein [unclassified Archaeoglobus]
MLIPKGDAIELGKRGSFRDVIRELSDSRFSGYVEVSYKITELSKGKVLFNNGKVVAAGIQRVISKKEVVGSDALRELLTLESCVVDVYALTEENVAKAMEWNKKAVVEELPEEESRVSGGLTEEVITTPDEREAILKKYGIRVPTQEEIDQLIINALEGGYEIIESTAETPVGSFESLKQALEETAELYLGKLSKKVNEVIESCSSTEELVDRFPEITSKAKSLVVFVSRKKIDDMLAEMERIISEYI